jgi:hypothetical protein
VKESKRQQKLKEKKVTHKLGIIVPYRDREQQLKRFLSHMKEYIKDIDYEIFIVEQADDKPFNRGKLLNAGYKYAVDKGCDYFVFHDIDMLPEDVDYSYSDKPLHLATHLQEHDYETTFFDYFGGVTMFTKEDFKTINGFSNEYWGWGFEDDDLLIRCIESDLEIDKEINSDLTDINEFEVFNFNGDSSQIKCTSKTVSSLLQDEFSIVAMVKPENLKINSNEEYDEFPIISIPGYNIGLFYNSFRRFFCQTFDLKKTPYSITSDIIGDSWTHLCMTYSNDNELTFYINGNKVDSLKMENEILQLSSDELFIGVASGKKTNKDFFYGLISDIEIYDISLGDEEVLEIYKNPNKIKLRNFGNFKSSEFLYSQINPQLATIDSVVDVGGEYKVETNNVSIKTIKQSFRTFLPKPHRRYSRFKSLKHKSNSSIGNRWVHSETRKNQIRFYNQVRDGLVDFRIDGLNTLRYDEVEKTESDLVTQIKLEL